MNDYILYTNTACDIQPEQKVAAQRCKSLPMRAMLLVPTPVLACLPYYSRILLCRYMTQEDSL